MKNLYKDPMKVEKNWGSEIIPKEEWINPAKNYTSNGKKVIGISIKMTADGSDRECTFPVKGTVVINNRGKLDFNIWTLDGRHNVVHSSMYDLKEVKNE